jgi:hypothetical protein
LQIYGLAFEIRASDWPNAESAQRTVQAIEAWLSRQPEDTLQALHVSLLTDESGTHMPEQGIHLRILWATLDIIARKVSGTTSAKCEVLAIRGPRETIH